MALSLGSQVSLQRGSLILIAVALAGASVAAAGTIGFIGLMSPHIARKLVGAQHEGLLPISGVVGGFLVVAADLVGRTIFAPTESAGLVVAAIVVPFHLLAHSQESEMSHLSWVICHLSFAIRYQLKQMKNDQ